MTTEIEISGDAWRDKTNALAEMEDDWQQWADAVCDPATPAHALLEIVHTLAPPFPSQHVHRARISVDDGLSLGGRRVLESIAAHPNAPPRLLRELLEIAPMEAAQGLCRNPVAPFLLLEAPAFVMNLPQIGQLALLRQSDCPSIFIQQMANASQFSAKSEKLRKYLNARGGGVEEAARLHVTVAGELPSEAGAWQSAVRNYWKTVCADPDADDANQAAELAEIGLAPPWAALGGAALAQSQGLQQLPNYPYLDAWFRYECAPGSAEEAAMLQQIGPDVTNREAVARALRADATPNDLIYVAQTEASGRGLIAQALLRHPNTNTHVLDALALAGRKGVRPLRELLMHPQTGPNALRTFMEHNNPSLRSLARQHKNAPNDNGETARAAFAARAYRDWETDRYPGSDTSLSPLASFVASLVYGSRSTPARLLNRAESLRWTERIEAVFIASAKPDLLRADEAGRTCADLLDHLSRDGNRLVRAAARAYSAEPFAPFVL